MPGIFLPTAPSQDGLGNLARLVVKAAMRFPATKDPMVRKKIVAEIFSQIHVRDRQIIGFRFRESLLSDTQMPEAATIMLSTPLPIGPQPEQLPEGTKRCIKCGEVKDVSGFYRTLNRCHPCRKIEEHERYERRKALAQHRL
jgi:hypothetical protein